MVEMLGVLAVVGVLSIGGIASYQYAMSKHRANTILYTVSEMAVVASSQLLSGNEMNLETYGDNIDGLYPFGWNGNYSQTHTDFSIDVSDVPAGVCEHVKNREFKMSFLTLINGQKDGACQSDVNAVEFVFKDNLDRGNEQERRSCSTDNDCAPFLGSGYKCNTTKGICEVQCSSTSTYVDEYGCCPNNKLWNGGCCSGSIKELEGEQVCYSNTTGTGCPEGQIYDTNSKSCINCADVTGVIRNGYFISCAMCPNLVQVSKFQCAPACTDPDAVLVGGVCKCPLERPLIASNNPADPQCLPCDYNGRTGGEAPYGVPVEEAYFTGYYCNRCNGGGYSDYCAPGTVGVSKGQNITLADGTTYKETATSCKPCSEVDVSALAYQASCESCGGTWVGDSWDNGFCEP